MSLGVVPPIDTPTALGHADALEALLTRLDVAARQDLPANDFFREAVEGVFASLPVQTASAWIESDGSLQCPHALSRQPRDNQREFGRVERMLAIAALQRSDTLVMPAGAVAEDADVANETPWLQLLVPRADEGIPGLVLQVGLDPSASLNVRETAGTLLSAVADIALTFQLHQRLRRLQRQEEFWKNLDAALQAMHAADGVKSCASVVAEQVRRLMNCDRASVLIRRGSRCRLVGISSTVPIDRRARQVKLLETLAGEAMSRDVPTQAIVGDGHAAAVLRVPMLDRYLDETQARGVRLEPLRPPTRSEDPERPVGVLVIENFTAAGTDAWSDRAPVLAAHAAQSLRRALDTQNQGWKRLLFPFRSLTSAALWTLFVLLLVAGAVALIVIPADFTVEATGKLMPARRQGIFSPGNAIVTMVHVDDDDTVTPQQPLVTLTDPDLELEWSRLQGELETAAARLDSVAARRKLRLRDPNIDTSTLSIEEEELKVTIEGLRKQLDVVQHRRDELKVLAPMAGRVARWDLRGVLQSLPVQHGQRLMDLYDPDAPWRLELDIPDDVSGYVRLADSGDSPRVDYVFQTDAAHIYTARLDHLSDATDLNAGGEMTVRGLVDLPPGQITAPRRGATVIAKIHCGRRSLGFVWFREIVEFVYKQILF